MSNRLLSVEFDPRGEKVEIHANHEGLDYLIKRLQSLKESPEPNHLHLMTLDWGGDELSNEQVGEGTDRITHVKVFLWP